MFRFTWRSLAAKRMRLLGTALAILLGVAFTSGTLILTDTMTRSVNTALDSMSQGVDVLVRGEKTVDTEMGVGRANVPLSTLDTVRAVPGVAAAQPYWESSAQVLDDKGKVLDVSQGVGLNWVPDPALSLFELNAGAAPAPGEVVLDSTTADKAGFGVGDTVQIVTNGEPEPFRVSGLAEMTDGTQMGMVSFALLSANDAVTRLGDGTSMWNVLARGADGVGEDELATRIAGATSGLDIVTGTEFTAERKDDLSDQLGSFRTVLLVFAGIALFVSCFTIANAFTITLAQRTRELALVRAMGGSRRQLVGSVVLEALMLGVIASLLGLVAGVGVAKGLLALFEAIGMGIPEGPLHVKTATLVVGVLVGVGVTVASAFLPARRAASVPPVAAMRDVALGTAGPTRRRYVTGAVLGIVAVVALVLGVAGSEPAVVGLGVGAAFFTAIVLGPVLVGPAVSVLGWPLRRSGVAGRLASSNAARSPRRSAATAAALMIGVTLVSGASLFAATAKESIRGDVEHTFTADRIARPLGTTPGVPTVLTAALGQVPGLQVAGVRSMPAATSGGTVTVTGVDVANAANLLRLDVVEGTVGSSSDGILVSRSAADEHGWSVGERVDLTFATGAAHSATVTGVFTDTDALSSIITPYAAVAAAGGDLFDDAVLLGGDDAALAQAERVLDRSPVVTVGSVADYATWQAGSLDMVLSVVIGFLGLAVVIAVLGIGTTVGLSVHERTRETGVLRAVGMSRRQVRRAIRWEAVMISGYGAVIGLVLGVGGTWALLSATDDFGTPVLPVNTFVVVAIGAVLAGVLAAAAPARRASRLAVLDALRSD